MNEIIRLLCEHYGLAEEDAEELVGVAGLLTKECKVWWSDKFDLEKEQ